MNAFVAAAWVISQVPMTFSSITVRNPFGVIASAGLEELAAGVVDQHVDAAVALDHAVEQRFDRLLVADVQRQALGLAAHTLDLGGQVLDQLGPAAAADHGRAEAGELQRRGAPQPRRRPGRRRPSCRDGQRGTKIRELSSIAAARRRLYGYSGAAIKVRADTKPLGGADPRVVAR